VRALCGRESTNHLIVFHPRRFIKFFQQYLITKAINNFLSTRAIEHIERRKIALIHYAIE